MDVVDGQRRSQNFFGGGGYKNFWGGIKFQYSCSVAVLTSFLQHKKFTWTDFRVYIYIPIPVYPPSLRPC